jgi:hypothetical protein
MRRFVYDRYFVSVPTDVIDTRSMRREDATRELGHIAIDDARERATIHAMPAHWTATIVAGDPLESSQVEFRVVRKRNRKRHDAPTS